jgi:hypothetical protein
VLVEHLPSKYETLRSNPSLSVNKRISLANKNEKKDSFSTINICGIVYLFSCLLVCLVLGFKSKVLCMLPCPILLSHTFSLVVCLQNQILTRFSCFKRHKGIKNERKESIQ